MPTEEVLRHTPTPAEVEILSPHICEYFSVPDRAPDRKRIAEAVSDALGAKGHGDWNAKRVRLWFRNNRLKYLGADPAAAIPPAELQPPLRMPALTIRVAPKVLGAVPAVPQERDPRAVALALVELSRFARDIPRSLRTKADATAAPLAAAEANFRACVALLPDPRPPVDFGITVVEMQGDAPPSPASPHIRVPVGTHHVRALPAPCERFYRGEAARPLPSVSNHADIECSLGGFGPDIVFAFYDRARLSHEIGKASHHIASGFVAPVTAMTFEGSRRIWAAADFRVRGFDLHTLAQSDLLYAGDLAPPPDAVERVFARAGLAVWHDLVVLGHERELTFWTRDTTSMPVLGWSWAARGGLPPVAESVVERRRGRARADCIATTFPGDIDQLCTCGEILVVASADSPVIRGYRRIGSRLPIRIEQVCVLLGHTRGITALVALKGTLFSGSADGTIKQWTNEGEPVLAYELARTRGTTESAVTALQTIEWECAPPGVPPVRRALLFSGHAPGVLRIWDLTGKAPVFEYDVSVPVEPSAPRQSFDFFSVLSVFTEFLTGSGGGGIGAREGVVGAGMNPAALSMPHPSGSRPKRAPGALAEGTRLKPRAITFSVLPHTQSCSLSVLGVALNHDKKVLSQIHTIEFSLAPIR